MILWYDGLDDLNGAEDVLFEFGTDIIQGEHPNPWGRVNGAVSPQVNIIPTALRIDAFPSGSGIVEGGFAFWQKVVGTGYNAERGIALTDANGNDKFRTNFGGGPTAHFNRADGTQLGTVSYDLYSWDHWEFQFKVHATTGYLIIRKNLVEQGNFTDIDTLGTGDAEACRIDLSTNWIPAGFGQVFWDDFVLYDLAAPNQGWLGYHRIREMGVDGAGVSADFGLYPDGGEVNYENIDETVPDKDTTYNVSGVSADLDDVTLEDYAGGANVVAVAASVDALQESVDTTQLKVGIITEGAATDEAAFDVGAVEYKRKTHVVHNNPDDSLPWDVTDLDGLKLKYEIA